MASLLQLLMGFLKKYLLVNSRRRGPGGVLFVKRFGRVSSPKRYRKEIKTTIPNPSKMPPDFSVIEFDYLIGPGFSGGPSVNSRGEVVGVNHNFVAAGFIFVSRAVPINHVKLDWHKQNVRDGVNKIFLHGDGTDPVPIPRWLPPILLNHDITKAKTLEISAPHATHVAGGKRPVPVPLPDEAMQPAQQKSKVPDLEKHLVTQLKLEELELEKLEKEIFNSREKIQFYCSRMQELILYKNRCDDSLNEIIERTSADKREAESLTSKLPLEEATFRDIQERKMELYWAIVTIGQDGNPDNIQVDADRIELQLEELVKSLNEYCKSYGLRVKPTTLVELPYATYSTVLTFFSVIKLWPILITLSLSLLVDYLLW